MLGGCGPDQFPLPPVVWEGDTVRVRMDDPGIEVCGGSFEGLDRHAALVREALRLEGDGMIDYSIGDQSFVNAACDGALIDDPYACTIIPEGRVFTRHVFIRHELVHSVRILDPTIGYRSSVFEEGLATLLGSDPIGKGMVPLEAEELFTDEHVVGDEEYYRAGQTMAILFDRYGSEAFRAFDVAARSVREDVAFVDTFGLSKEEFAAIAEAEPHCEQSQWWMPLLECEGEPVVADAETGALSLRGDVSCGQPDVRGPEYGRIWTSRRFRLDRRTSTLGYDIEMPEDATLEIVACNGGCPERFAYSGARDAVGSINNGLPNLEPGEYFLRMSRPMTDGDGHFEVVLHRG